MKSNLEEIKEAYLSFRLGDELFATSVSNVLEVLEIQRITKVPKSPDYLRGVINFRGEILPVVDTRIKFNLPKSEDTSSTIIVVLDILLSGKRISIGALADSVQDVLEFTKSEIKAVPEFGSRYNTEFLLGMKQVNDIFIMILNIQKVFSVEELTILRSTEPSDNAIL